MTSSPAPEPISDLPSRAGARSWVAAGVCALAGFVVFQFFGNANHGYIDTSSLFWWWIFQWINPASETEHGWLILVIAGFLLWRNLGEASGKTNRSDGSPLAAMLAGLALHAIGFAAQQARVSIIALLIFVWGALRLGGGRRWGRAAMFPVAFMVFSIPLTVLDSAGFWLRMWVIEASATIAHWAHIDVLRNGTQLVAPDGRFNYDVAPACSGVRSLMALTALSLLIGYMSFRSWWRRGLMLLLCFPLVYVGNVARITSIIFAARLAGPRGGSVAHDVMGWGIFVIVLGGVLLATRWLERWWPEREENQTDQADLTDRSYRRLSFAAVATAVVALAGIEAAFLNHLTTMPQRGLVGIALTADGRNPVELPMLLGHDWVGVPKAITTIEHEILPPDTGFSRIEYVASRDSRHVLVSVILSGRDRTSIHRPELCLVGQGWTITGRMTRDFAYPGGAAFPATILNLEQRVTGPHGPVVVRNLVAYWFVGGDKVVATHWQRLAYDAYNRVLHARADRWSYVLLETDAADGEAAALTRMQAVLKETLPTFQRVTTERKP